MEARPESVGGALRVGQALECGRSLGMWEELGNVGGAWSKDVRDSFGLIKGGD